MASGNDDMRMRIVRAAARLCETADFEGLSVTAICREVGISRPTFYANFQDKYEIVQWHFDGVCATRLAQAGRTMTWEEANLANLRALRELSSLYRSAFKHPKGYQNITAYGYRKLKEYLLSALLEKYPDGIDDKVMFQLGFFARGAADVIALWGRSEDYTVERFAELLDSCMPRELLTLVNSGVAE